jgi:hypothetical protein
MPSAQPQVLCKCSPTIVRSGVVQVRGRAGCPVCLGTGIVLLLCRTCGGAGMVPGSKICPHCSGKGKEAA